MSIHPRKLELWNEVICTKKGRKIFKDANGDKTTIIARWTSECKLISWEVVDDFDNLIIGNFFDRSREEPNKWKVTQTTSHIYQGWHDSLYIRSDPCREGGYFTPILVKSRLSGYELKYFRYIESLFLPALRTDRKVKEFVKFLGGIFPLPEEMIYYIVLFLLRGEIFTFL